MHVFVFAMAFPLFNNVDEQFHFDLAVKYSHGHLPAGLELVSEETARELSFYSTYEYLQNPTNFPDGRFPPPLWMMPPEEAGSVFVSHTTAWSKVRNAESSQPPLYYALAGGWRRFVQWCGLGTYFVRILNVFLMAALVWLSYAAARLVFPERPFIRLGVPALIAFMPQTAFYSINNDVLSPVCFGAAFIFVVKWLRAENPSVGLGAAVGLTLSATFLSKFSNLPLLAVTAAAVLLEIFRLAGSGKLRAAMPSLAAMLLCAVLPVAVWMTWCKLDFGDFTGSSEKIQYLGWTLKPFGEWWHHPIFTPHGAWTFVSGLLAAFWQGEFLWHRQPLALPVVNWVYILMTLGILALVLIGRFSRATDSQRQALGLALANVAASVLFLALLSLIYDFGKCFNPSREHPYFTSGRLLLGALIPFFLLFIFGMDRALSRLGNPGKFLALAGMISFMLIAETATDWPVFFSQYNWFHL